MDWFQIVHFTGLFFLLKEENTFVQLDKKIKYAVTHLFAFNNNECLLVFPNEVRMKF